VDSLKLNNFFAQAWHFTSMLGAKFHVFFLYFLLHCSMDINIYFQKNSAFTPWKKWGMQF